MLLEKCRNLFKNGHEIHRTLVASLEVRRRSFCWQKKKRHSTKFTKILVAHSRKTLHESSKIVFDEHALHFATIQF